MIMSRTEIDIVCTLLENDFSAEDISLSIKELAKTEDLCKEIEILDAIEAGEE